MRIVDTATYTKDAPGFTTYERDNIYCGIDSAVTVEVFPKLLSLTDDLTRKTYEFECAQSIIAAVMSDRGLRVDEAARLRLVFDFENELSGLFSYGQEMGKEAFGIPDFNPASPAQLMEVFYEILKVPVQYKKERYKEKKPTVNEEALEIICNYLYARPLAKLALAIREVRGLLRVVKSGVDSDGRMRAEFEPGATKTARWASRKNALGGGTNFQNITDRMRQIFVPDEGYFFAYLDLERAESYSTGYYADDEAYIEACKSSDLHVAVSNKMWPGVDPKSVYHKWHTHRDIAKKAGHATNNAGNAYGIGRVIGVETAILEKFQAEYFASFPGIKRHHANVMQQLQAEHQYTTVLGRRRHFFGRAWDRETLKDAVSHINQCTVGDILGIGLDKIFWKYDRNEDSADVKLVAQIHDAGLFLIREGREAIIPELISMMEIPVPFPSGKTMTIPVSAKVGYNWAEETPANPNGLGKLEDLSKKKLVLETLM